MQKQEFGIVLPIVLLSYFMIVLDNSIIFTSTAKIAENLSLDTQSLAWITNAYALTFGGFLLFSGKAGDIIGRKKFFQIGLVLFSVSSLLVGISVNAEMIIAMRAIQGIGSSILAPSTLALLMDNYSDDMRTKAIAYYGTIGGLGASFGLIIGGMITTYSSWRIGFIINVPIGLILLLLSYRYLKTSKVYNQKLDFIGTILSILGISALVYSINGTSYRQISLIVSIISLILFVLYESRSDKPIMPLVLFKDKERSFAYLTRFFFVGASISYFFLTPLALQSVYGFTPLQAAIGFLPETIPQFIAATLVARMVNINVSKTISVGTILVFVGSLLAALVKIQSSYWIAIAIPMVIMGIGQGLALGILTVAGVAHTTPKLSGSASGIVNTVHQIGGSVGLSAVVALTSQYKGPVTSYNMSMVWITVISAIAMICAIGIIQADKKI
ncbi:MFS transporter [Companilactobacillus allii]|uniref:MFS transporter n=1 Tax=Companilactobacillus allii TaxID=1847728 RepID=A0A1P8Q5T6_9LACO|nr:MFS transporter [Companilactobacillus allii]APX73201.1 MFS transporter [Companilactobacillus allii]USQ68010.1 MFS transporter [Companilactobacillus allii]